MPDYRYSTVGPSDAGSTQQWEAFALDPAGDGSLAPYIVDDGEGNMVEAPGVSIYHFVDQLGNRRYDVRLFGSVQAVSDDDGTKDHPTKVDENGNPIKIRGSKIREQFKVKGNSGNQKLTRKRATYDKNGDVTGEEIWADATVVNGQWRNIRLMGDADDGTLEGNTVGPDSELIEHTWL